MRSELIERRRRHWKRNGKDKGESEREKNFEKKSVTMREQKRKRVNCWTCEQIFSYPLEENSENSRKKNQI